MHCAATALQLLLKCICYPLNSGDLASLIEKGFRSRNVNASHYFARIHQLP